MINPQDSCSEHSSPILAKNVTEFPDISAKYKASSFNIYVKAKGGNYLIFNTMTGALAHIAGDKYTHLAGLLKNPNSFGRENEEEKLFLKSALKAGFIIDDKTNELEMLKMISFAGRFTSEHFHLTIMPTLQCNFACTYCYEKPRPGIMRPEVRQALIKWAEMKVKTSNLFSVAWFGGEPLLAHGCIRELSSNFIGLCARKMLSIGPELPQMDIL